MQIIAGDIGGTKTLLRLVDLSSGIGQVVVERRFESGAYPTFDKLLHDFLALTRGAVSVACFAVAGPVLGDRAEVTNLQWVMEGAKLSQAFGIPHVSLINDFYANALGVPLLQPDDMVTLNAGKRDLTAPIAILGAGTGLGEALMVHDGRRYNVVPSEGGHADFAPQDEEQAQLFISLHKRYGGHVSWERLLSGMGLVNIFTFLRDREAKGVAPHDASSDAENLPIHIAQLAQNGDRLALATMAMFVDIYGSEAGNFALRLLARGGVFLAGGIAAKNLPFFTDGRFREAFLRKGRFRQILEDIPVELITNASVGLIGAAEMARRLAGA
jgi:glucokinase